MSLEKKRKRSAPVPAASPAATDLPQLAVHLLPDEALKELEAIAGSISNPSQLNVLHIKELLSATLVQRENTFIDCLPVYFLNEDCLMHKAELRF